MAFKQATVAALIATSAMVCHATTGNELLQHCREVEKRLDDPEANVSQFRFGYCIGLVEGIKNTLTVTSHLAGTNCLPATITNDQAVRIVLKHLRANPETLHQEGTVLAIAAFAKMFNCRQ